MKLTDSGPLFEKVEIAVTEVDFSVDEQARLHFPFLTAAPGIYKPADMSNLEFHGNVGLIKAIEIEFVPCYNLNRSNCASDGEIESFLDSHSF